MWVTRRPLSKAFPLQLIVNEKSQNLRRLQAQRNELNAKGRAWAPGACAGSSGLGLEGSGLGFGALG